MIRLAAYTFTYPDMPRPALEGVSARLPTGATVLASGPSGCGKSTLLRALNGLVPHFTGGQVKGRLLVAGIDPLAAGPAIMSDIVGYVANDPEACTVTDSVADEVAFALEERGTSPRHIRRRVASALEAAGLLPLAGRRIDTLSGGERQRTVIAAALALAPQVLVLDEPTSQLDDAAADEVLAAVSDLASRGGLTVVLSEHRRRRILPYVTHELRFGAPGEPPTLRTPVPTDGLGERPVTRRPTAPGAVVLRLDGLRFSYGPYPVLADVSCEVRAGEIVALTGPSGSGKTTLLRLIAGLLRPQGGRREVVEQPSSDRCSAMSRRPIGYLPQDPGALLFAETVYDEVAALPIGTGGGRRASRRVWALLHALGLAEVADRYPRDLSTGQRQRVALAAIAIAEPQLLLLDEPTRGLDDEAIFALGQLLDRLAADGAAILVATHDRRLSRWADRRLELVNVDATSGARTQAAAVPA